MLRKLSVVGAGTTGVQITTEDAPAVCNNQALTAEVDCCVVHQTGAVRYQRAKSGGTKMPPDMIS